MRLTDRETRTRVLYLAPWVDYGGSDKGTLDWFKWIDRSRFELSLATTQPSDNRRLAEALPYAEEVWPLPDLIDGQDMPAFLFDFIETRGVEVLHVMNSRLGYELLADLSGLPNRPRVVVQLHVEEQDRSGYVRLICRRYGNLVDAFSVSSEHLARAVEGHDVPRSRIHVIGTGVDAEDEFAPDRVSPVAGLEPGAVNVLYPGRLVDQKDPLLMLEVAALVTAERDDVRFHVVGDGPLEPALREGIAARGLERHVLLHPPTNALAGWYAASDLLLMTSTFEGVPYVLYEAMAMGLPAVVPALPGNRELLAGGGGGELIDPRDDAAAYAAALLRLAGDASRTEEIGRASRDRALGELSVRTMAARHEQLYDELLAGTEPPPRSGPDYPPAPAVLPTRSRSGHPLVSVIVPCFNHGRYLPDCLAALRAQTWPEVEILVVDDASTEPDTLEVLDELERAGDARLLRLATNGGPSHARNAALDLVRGRYILPVDADNLLIEDAIERLVEQLTEASMDVGYVYPNLQYFGNRRDYFEAPAYNLAALMEGNFCDTCSLFDAQPFRDGLRFRDEIALGHEDWSLALDLATRGIRGEPAHEPTVLYRKSGFTRSDLVEYESTTFAATVPGRHPELFGDVMHGPYGRYAGPAVSVKAAWSPGLSLVALAPVEPDDEEGHTLYQRLLRQSHADFELLLRSERDWPAMRRAPAVRRLPAQLAECAAAALGDALAAARAPIVLATAGTGSDLLRDNGFVEKIARVMYAQPEIEHVVLVDAGEAGRYPMRRLGPDEATDARAHAIAFRRGAGQSLPPAAQLDRDAPIESLVWLAAAGACVRLHHPRGRRGAPGGGAPGLRHVALAEPAPRNAAERGEREGRYQRKAAIPAPGAAHIRRWGLAATWMPPETMLLVRHRAWDHDHWIVTNHPTPPPGYTIDFELGAIRHFQPPGTAELRSGGPEGYYVIPEGDEGSPQLREPRHPDCLGYLEQAPLPLLDALELAFHPTSGKMVLICGPDDPLTATVAERRFLGFIEPYPIRPRLLSPRPLPTGVRGLVRTVDTHAHRHRYGVGVIPEGELSLELGALHTDPRNGSIALYIQDGRVWSEWLPGEPPRSPLTAARWAASPLAWRDAGPTKPRARAAARRGAQGLTGTIRRRRRQHNPTGDPAGYLWPWGGPGRQPLYAALHPVTGDQLLTPWVWEAGDLNYGPPVLLGYIAELAPVTGSLERRQVDVPWGSRFGRQVRRR
jgi:glycosyltransferase involved in cell wall biosynthesis